MICFFNSCREWGGGEKWHYDASSYLNTIGEQIVVVANKESELAEKCIKNKIQLHQINVTNLSFLNAFKLFKTALWLKKNNIKEIIMNLPNDLKFAGIAAKLAGVERIIYRRGSAIPIKNTVLNRFLFKYIVTDIIANSKETKETILKNNKELFQKEKIKVIYNGIDFDEYDKRDYKKIYTKTDDEFIIGNAGRLCEQKGQKYLIDLAEKLSESDMKYKIIIAGKGELEEELRQKVKEKKLEDNIIFLGFVENIKEFMESIDIFVLTSIWEGFGYVLAEAMASKKPAVAFNISSNSELITDDITGFLIQPFDIEEMKNKIMKLYTNKELIKKFGEDGNRIAREKFCIKRSNEELKKMLKEV